jgi:hypothetical protein
MKLWVLRSLAAGVAMALSPAAVQAEPPEAPVEQLKEPALVPVKADAIHPFGVMAGNWTGGGTIELTNDIKETLRCRASYVYGQANSSLALSIRCASDNYKFELSSNVLERRGQLSGDWKEASYGVSGSITGRLAGNRVSATAKGDSFSAALALTTNGNRQSVSITPEATYIINVQIALNKVQAVPAATQRATR